MVRARLKPWPRDAVVIVAAAAGEEVREEMDAVHRCACRDCRRPLHAAVHTVRRAERDPGRHGRPIAFLCLACYHTYDHHTVDILVDDRREGS